VALVISHQPAVLFPQNKPATSNQPAVLFSQNKPAPAISHQPTEQAANLGEKGGEGLRSFSIEPSVSPEVGMAKHTFRKNTKDSVASMSHLSFVRADFGDSC
jgi:hypothetical protein